VNFFHVLTLLLVVLKVLGYFQHSWWLVFAPSIVSFALGLLILLLAGLAFVVKEVL
jgi:hypothetical protein